MNIGKTSGIVLTALKSNVVELKRPYKLNFAVTYWCQSRCMTCNIWQMKPKGELTIEEVRKFAGKNNYFRWIELTGGEVFLRNDIVEIAEAFSQSCKGLYILTMPTNSLCNKSLVEKRLKSILELSIPKIVVTVSLDGYRALHDKIRGVPGNYDKAIGTFKMLKELKKQYGKLEFVFGYTLSKFNQGCFKQTFEAVKRDIPDITYNDFHVNLGQISENYYSNNEMDLRAENGAVVKELDEILANRRFMLDPIQAIESTFLKNLARYAATGKSPMRSRSMEASVFMDSYGNVYPSIMWNAKIGSIRDADYDLAPLLDGETATSIRKQVKENKEPEQWTSCEAYQTILGNIKSLL